MDNLVKTTVSRRTMMLSLAAAAAIRSAFAKVGNVEVGVTGSDEDFSKAVEYGFDYYEPSAMVIAGLTDSAFADFRAKVMASRMRCKCFNHLMGGADLIVVGPTVNQNAVVNYLDSTLNRCKQLGGEMVVYGSPGTRKVPEGFSKDHAWRQLVSFLQRAGDIAQSKGLIVAIEPCNQKETNTLNTGEETLRILHDVNHPCVKMIIDVRHMRAEKEDPSIVLKARDQLVHFHFSAPLPKGGWPKTVEEDPDYPRLFGYLKEIYFHGGISIEAQGKFETDAAPALAVFKKLLT